MPMQCLKISWDRIVTEILRPQSIGTFSFGAAHLVLEDVVTTVLDIVVKAWPAVVTGGKVKSDSHEDDITDVLRWEMDAEKKRRRLVPQLRFEREAQSDLPDKSRRVGLIDVLVIYSFEQREYLAIECKRVADADSNLTKLYVTQGVTRFVTGKYSLGHPFGAMVGYVCAGRCEEVAGQIGTTLSGFDRQVTALAENCPWQAESRFGAIPNLFSTKHTQTDTTSEITLLHLFLAFVST
jgi:hypothetical protein